MNLMVHGLRHQRYSGEHFPAAAPDQGVAAFLPRLFKIAMSDKRELRILLRARRRALSAAQQRHAAQRLAAHLCRQVEINRLQHIAAYWPNDGEIDPRIFMQQMAARGVAVYLPVITRNGAMQFARWQPRQPLTPNHLGIPEPHWRRTALRPLWKIDAVLMPLVGFDRFGNRLGMGAGFYDRALAAIAGCARQPQCWGLAHACQEVRELPCDDWDMPLRRVITERGVKRFARR